MTKDDATTLITNVLTALGYSTPVFVNLLLGTMAQESHLGQYETQMNNGPARGVYMCEDITFQDLYANFLSFHAALKTAVDQYKPTYSSNFTADWLVHNHEYATAIAACQYIRHHVPLPTTDANDVNALWSIYKQYYNTIYGAATETEFINNYNEYVND